MLLSQLLYRGFGLGRLLGGLAGALLGWSLLFGGMQFWFLFQPNLTHKDQFLAPDYFIIHKAMPVINLLGQGALAFSDAEIAELKKQPGIKAVATFLSSRFKAHAFFGEGRTFASLATDLFFEAVPEEFLDVKAQAWHWLPNATNAPLPIIISRDYLTLYNFGFAQSQNLPQVSDRLITKVRFSVQVSGQGKEQNFDARIVGFSDRINSILAPYDFVQWANTTFGEGPALPSRLMVKVDNAEAQQVLRYFTAKNYQYNTEQLKTAQLRSILRALLYLVSAFGLLILFLAFWVLALSFQLLISRNRERIQKLIWLGYHPAALVSQYILFLLVLVMVVNLGCLLFLAWGTSVVAPLFTHYGYTAGSSALWRPVLWMSLLSLLILAFNYLLLRKQIYRLA